METAEQHVAERHGDTELQASVPFAFLTLSLLEKKEKTLVKVPSPVQTDVVALTKVDSFFSS